MIYIFIVVTLLVILIVFARFSDIKIISLREGKIEFWKPKKEKSLLVSPCFSIDPVISKDGKIYKIHLIISLLITKKVDITNWVLKIRKLSSMVFKQYFLQDSRGQRHSLGKIVNLPIHVNENFIIGLEFEPEKDYNPLTFQEKIYKTELTCGTPEGFQKKRFKFRVRERNLKAIEIAAKEAMKDKQPKVVSFPIII